MAIIGKENSVQSPGSTDTIQCPTGQVLVNGVCVAANLSQGLNQQGSMQSGFGAPVTSRDYNPFSKQKQAQNTANTQLQDAFGAIRGSLEGTAQANIEASRAQTEANQAELARQLELQRQDYLSNRQNLQKETFLRGRNILSNLANRGLATSGLQQLGDVQRTIATGQQMNELSRAFENARQGLTSQQQAASRGQTAFEAQQRTGLAQQLASTDLQEIQMTGTEKERSIAYAESLATLLADPNIPQATKDTLAPLYEQLITTLPQTPTTEGGTITEALGTATTSDTAGQLSQNIVTDYGSNLTTLEKDKLNEVIGDSEMLAQGSEFRTALSAIPEGTQTGVSVTRTTGNKAGLNDTYEVVLNGQGYSLEGRELAVLIMNGDINVSPEIAVSIVQRAGGRVAQEQGTTGNQWDAILKPYLRYLQEKEYITGRQGLANDYKILIDNPIR